MKKLICVLGALMMLFAVAAAEQVILPWEGECPHLLCDFGVVLAEHRVYVDEQSDPTGYSSAICAYCEETYLLVPAGSGWNMQVVDDRECTHMICTRGEKISEGWEPTFNSFAEVRGQEIKYFSSSHEYRIYYACECVGCGKKLHYYEGVQVNGMGMTQHEYEAFGASGSIHLHEANQHLYLTTCTICGYQSATLQYCYVWDNGLCLIQMQEAQSYYTD